MPKDLIKNSLSVESLVDSLDVPDERKTEAKTILKHYFEEHPQNDFADKFSAYFFAGTRPIDEGLFNSDQKYTILYYRRIQRRTHP